MKSHVSKKTDQNRDINIVISIPRGYLGYSERSAKLYRLRATLKESLRVLAGQNESYSARLVIFGHLSFCS